MRSARPCEFLRTKWPPTRKWSSPGPRVDRLVPSSAFSSSSSSRSSDPDADDAHRSAENIRRSFIDYFKDKGHVFVPSSSVIPRKDEGTYFVNAGMNQFKPVFLGICPPPHPAVVNSQKCIRVGGKHNDLSDVGYDTYHHTFFEMLGTWSFKDADKEGACRSAWELLTEVYRFPPNRLYVTVFGGDPSRGLPADSETYDIWTRVGVNPKSISWGSTKDNFWEMGETGPCGVSTEIHYDVIGGREASSGVNVDGSYVIELWNLVFIEHERESTSLLRPLGYRHLDTGMGFERLVAAIQGKISNYDTDLFRPIFDSIQNVTKSESYGGRFGHSPEAGVDAAYRIIADHVRMSSVAVADGLLPTSKGLGSKLRHVIERASHEMHVTLKTPPGSLASLVHPVVESLSPVYPELSRKESFIREVVDSSESHFFAQKILARQVFDAALRSLKISDGVISGESAWDVCDSKNIPLEIFCDLAAERSLAVDVGAFDRKLEEHKERSQPALAGSKQSRPADILGILKRREAHVRTTVQRGVKKTLDSFKNDYRVEGQYCLFPGLEAQLVAIVVDGDVADSIATTPSTSSTSSHSFVAVFNGTNFYAEAGGQRADSGKICRGENEMQIVDVQAEDGYVLHYGTMRKGEFKVGDLCTLSIDADRRMKLMANHSATHLLNFALRNVLGENTLQMGSMVDEDKFTFDFYTTKAVDTQLVQMVDIAVNIVIDHNMPVFHSSMALKEAKKLRDLVTMDTEPYPELVSVVSVGMPVHSIAKIDSPDAPPYKPVSLELCCGTHVRNTGAIEKFVITNVSGVGHNVKRITAVTRYAAKEALKNVPLITSHVETFESEMVNARRHLLAEGNNVAVTVGSSSSSTTPSISTDLSGDPLTSPTLPPFDEIDAKLSVVKANLRENPLPVDSRLELERRLAEVGPEIARLKHIRDLKKKDAIAAHIYDQLSREVELRGRGEGDDTNAESINSNIGAPTCRFLVSRLKFTLDDYSAKSVSKALARAPRQLQNVNNDERLTGLFLYQTENEVFALGYVPDEMQDRLSASDWVLHSLSCVDGVRPKGTPIKKKLSEHLMYFGWVEAVSSPEAVVTLVRQRAEELANRTLESD